MKTKAHLLVVRNLAQKILYDTELRGQISDGHWENKTTDRRLWTCYVVVSGWSRESDVGISFTPNCRVLHFDDPDLIEVVGDRMLEAVRKEIPNYTMEDMYRDLDDLTHIVFYWNGDEK